jgi:serine/threonine protein kinase
MSRRRDDHRKQAKEAAPPTRARAKRGTPPPPPRYRVLESLGLGGMGEVFKARLTGSAGFQHDVVLKRLHAQNVGDSEFATMFGDEARLLGFLRHPNVVQALDFYEEGGQLFLVLEYIEGPSLSDIFRDGRDVPPAIVAFLGREICRALDYVHGVRAADGTPLGVVHQDVTPSNVMLTTDGTVKLLDFGLARFAHARHVAAVGMVKGKPSYLAPEQLRADQIIDGRVDLFSLGIVMHELLTGTRLFRGEDDLATLKQIGEKKISAPSQTRAGVPRPLDRIVMRALERDPARRYPNAAAMARDLDEVVFASRLRVAEVAAFARGIASPAQAKLAAPQRSTMRIADVLTEAVTRRDLGQSLSRWVSSLPGGRRAALVTGLGVALGLGTLGLGARLRPARTPLAPSTLPAVGSSSRTDPRSPSAVRAPLPSPRVSLAAAF